MMDKRLVERISHARRELRIAEGEATEEELRLAAFDRQMEEFRTQVNDSLDMVASYLLEIEFARDEEGPMARLTAEGKCFELRQHGSRNLALRDATSRRILLSVIAGAPQSADRIVCAVADSLAPTAQSA